MKQKVRLIIIVAIEFVAILAMVLLIFFAGKKTYTVTFDLNGGTLISGDLTQTVTQGQSANPPTVARNGCYFLKWSGSYRGVTDDVTVRAVWEYETTPGLEYESAKDSNYCVVSGSYEHLQGEVYIGAYHDEKKVLGIKDGAFKDRDGITAVYLLEGIVSIGAEAFADCDNLEKCQLPTDLVILGDNAFYGCEKLAEIELPKTLQTIGANAFSGCVALKEVVLPESVLTIGVNAFDTPQLVVHSYLKQDQVPTGWVVGWHSVDVTVAWEYAEPEDDETEDGKGR